MALTRKQAAYVREIGAGRRWNVKTGAVRSGKTWADIACVIPWCVMHAPVGSEVVLIGNTQGSVARNILTPMRRLWQVSPAVHGAGDAMVGRMQGDGTVRLFGRTAHILGADTADRAKALQGMSIGYAYGDEITTWHRDVFEMLKSRLDRAESRFDGTCNPAAPGHWFRAFLQSGADVFLQEYIIDDNGYLAPAFVRNLKAEYAGSVYYDRYILGKWTKAEGLVYGGFEGRMLVAAGDLPQIKRMGFAVDVGHANATAFLAVGMGEDGVAYVVDEYYHSGRVDGVMSPLGYARAFVKFRDGVMVKFAGAAMDGVYVDPSAVGFMAQLREVGVVRVYKAHNAVLAGIARVAAALDGGRLRVCEGCTNLRREMAGYVWDEGAARAGEDRPVKVDDHCVDALRYWALARLRS